MLQVLFHTIVSCTTFYSQAIITEDRLVPSLNTLSHQFHIPHDVAAATIMAAGSASPNLLAVTISLFITKSSLGMGTVIGSEMFQQLFVVGGSVMACRRRTRTADTSSTKHNQQDDGDSYLALNPWVFLREVFFYALSLIMLLWIMTKDVRMEKEEYIITLNANSTYGNAADGDYDEEEEDSDAASSSFSYEYNNHVYISTWDGLAFLSLYVVYVVVCSNFERVVAFIRIMASSKTNFGKHIGNGTLMLMNCSNNKTDSCVATATSQVGQQSTFHSTEPSADFFHMNGEFKDDVNKDPDTILDKRRQYQKNTSWKSSSSLSRTMILQSQISGSSRNINDGFNYELNGAAAESHINTSLSSNDDNNTTASADVVAATVSLHKSSIHNKSSRTTNSSSSSIPFLKQMRHEPWNNFHNIDSPHCETAIDSDINIDFVEKNNANNDNKDIPDEETDTMNSNALSSSSASLSSNLFGDCTYHASSTTLSVNDVFVNIPHKSRTSSPGSSRNNLLRSSRNSSTASLNSNYVNKKANNYMANDVGYEGFVEDTFGFLDISDIKNNNSQDSNLVLSNIFLKHPQVRDSSKQKQQVEQQKKKTDSDLNDTTTTNSSSMFDYVRDLECGHNIGDATASSSCNRNCNDVCNTTIRKKIHKKVRKQIKQFQFQKRLNRIPYKLHNMLVDAPSPSPHLSNKRVGDKSGGDCDIGNNNRKKKPSQLYNLEDVQIEHHVVEQELQQHPHGHNTTKALTTTNTTLSCFLWQQSDFHDKARIDTNAWQLRWFTFRSSSSNDEISPATLATTATAAMTDVFMHNSISSVPNKLGYQSQKRYYPSFDCLDMDGLHLILRLSKKDNNSSGCDPTSPLPPPLYSYTFMAPNDKVLEHVVRIVEEIMDNNEQQRQQKLNTIHQLKQLEKQQQQEPYCHDGDWTETSNTLANNMNNDCVEKGTVTAEAFSPTSTETSIFSKNYKPPSPLEVQNFQATPITHTASTICSSSGELTKQQYLQQAQRQMMEEQQQQLAIQEQQQIIETLSSTTEDIPSFTDAPPPGSSRFTIYFHAIMLPLKVLLQCTIPDVRRYCTTTEDRGSSMKQTNNKDNSKIATTSYQIFITMISILSCIMHLSLNSYFMVSSLETIGAHLHIPNSILGITVSAIGTSLPIYVASVSAARQGLGNMAVSNALGSNTFNILIALGLPWTVYTVTVAKTSSTVAAANGMYHSLREDDGVIFSIVLLLVILLCMVGVVSMNEFVLTKHHAYGLMGMYVLYLLYAVLDEVLLGEEGG